MNFQGKTFLITGGTSGIGLQAAKDLCESGAKVIIVDYLQNKIDEALRLLPEGNWGVLCDLREPRGVKSIFDFSAEKGIEFDGMVYCAGISPLMTVAENDCKVMEDTFAVNCLSFIECVKYYLREGCGKQNSSIVTISSIAASQSTNRQCVYAGSKAALEAAVRCMAKELMGRRIRVNALALGGVRTEMFAELEKQNPTLESRYPLGAIPMEQVSGLISYLLSDQSNHMTGSILKMDAGHDVWLRS